MGLRRRAFPACSARPAPCLQRSPCPLPSALAPPPAFSPRPAPCLQRSPRPLPAALAPPSAPRRARPTYPTCLPCSLPSRLPLLQGAPYAFDYLLFILKTYRQTEDIAADAPPPGKRARVAAPVPDTTYYFHEEEEYIHQVTNRRAGLSRGASCVPLTPVACVAVALMSVCVCVSGRALQAAIFQVAYRPSDAQAATRRTFAKISIKPGRQLVLVPFARMAGIVDRMERDVAAAAHGTGGS